MLQGNSQIYQSLSLNRIGYFISLSLAIVTLVTFVLAFLTPPRSGPLCTVNCFDYPYTDIINRFPRDYLWMYPAILLTIIYVVFMVCIHHHTSKDRKLFSQIGVSFALMGASTLIIDYFVQLAV